MDTKNSNQITAQDIPQNILQRYLLTIPFFLSLNFSKIKATTSAAAKLLLLKTHKTVNNYFPKKSSFFMGQ